VSARVGGGLWLPGTKRRAAPNIGKYGRQFIICVILSINWGATLLRSTYLDSSRHPDSNGIDVFAKLPVFVLSVVPTITSFQTCTVGAVCCTSDGRSADLRRQTGRVAASSSRREVAPRLSTSCPGVWAAVADIGRIYGVRPLQISVIACEWNSPALWLIIPALLQ